MFFNKKIEGACPPGEESGAEEVSIEQILAAGISRGLRAEDSERLTLGMWVDYIIEFNNMEYRARQRKDEPENRMATQEDFDRF